MSEDLSPDGAFEFEDDVLAAPAARPRPYERLTRDPLYRPLRILTVNPTVVGPASAVAIINVPFEPLRPGPVGALFEVVDFDETRQDTYEPVDLDDPRALMEAGVEPSPDDPRFHQQMVYAVCQSAYTAFCAALGRIVIWAFPKRSGDVSAPARLRLRPHAFEGPNTYYDPDAGELCFGYFRQAVRGRARPGELTFTCLSQDLVVHELTHALVHGVRPRLTLPTGEDVFAFHEAFADLVSVFHQFSSASMVRDAVRRIRLEVGGGDLIAQYVDAVTGRLGDPSGAEALPGDAKGSGPGRPTVYYTAGMNVFDAAALLVSAVFEAFGQAFHRKVRRHVLLATGDTGVLAPGAISPTLDEALAEEASKLASRFLAMCVRALDYCPPVDVTFGELLRAVITADRELVPNDRWRYRELWIEAFRRRGIYPDDIVHMSEDALLWQPPPRQMPICKSLAFGMIRFEGDPRYPASLVEQRRQMAAVGRLVSDPSLAPVFGIVAADDPRLRGDPVTAPRIGPVRTAVRVGPDGQLMNVTVAEVGQRRTARSFRKARVPHEIHGGATIVFGPDGDVRYAISKSVVGEARVEREMAFARGVGREVSSSRGVSSAFLPRGGEKVPSPSAIRGRKPAPRAVAAMRTTDDPFAQERRARSAGIRACHRLFVSYAHEDIDWLRRLRTALRPLDRDFDLTIWADTEIRAGDEWEKKIGDALEGTTLAIVLVSQDFVASQFVIERELPMLLRAVERGQLRLLCVAVSSVLSERLPIAKFQWLNPPERPLDLFSVPEQNREFVAIARQVAEQLDEYSRSGAPVAAASERELGH